MTRSLSLFLCAAILTVLAASCGGSSKEAAVTPEEIQAGASIEVRLAARPAWLNSGDSLKAADIAGDPHVFACAACHGRADMTDKEWKATCSGSSCHFRAWPKTQMHRVELAVFNRCENCHKPHVFSLDGKDCLSCHGSMGTVPVTSIGWLSTAPAGGISKLTVGAAVSATSRTFRSAVCTPTPPSTSTAVATTA